MADNSISLNLYKIFMIILKYGPFILGLLSLIAVICGCIGFAPGFYALFGYTGLLPSLFWIIASFTFKCCIWHRLPIYYCWVNNIISWIDFRWPIPVDNLQMIMIYLIMALVFILLGMYFKNRYNVRKWSKERTA
jgi:hypothetical protein